MMIILGYKVQEACGVRSLPRRNNTHFFIANLRKNRARRIEFQWSEISGAIYQQFTFQLSIPQKYARNNSTIFLIIICSLMQMHVLCIKKKNRFIDVFESKSSNLIQVEVVFSLFRSCVYQIIFVQRCMFLSSFLYFCTLTIVSQTAITAYAKSLSICRRSEKKTLLITHLHIRLFV